MVDRPMSKFRTSTRPLVQSDSDFTLERDKLVVVRCRINYVNGGSSITYGKTNRLIFHKSKWLWWKKYAIFYVDSTTAWFLLLRYLILVSFKREMVLFSIQCEKLTWNEFISKHVKFKLWFVIFFKEKIPPLSSTHFEWQVQPPILSIKYTIVIYRLKGPFVLYWKILSLSCSLQQVR